MTEQDTTTLGLPDEILASQPTVYAKDLFAGQTWLVSGGASGLGKATAWLAGRLGATVLICGRTTEKLERAALAMTRAGLKVATRRVNIREPDQVDALFAWATGEFAGIDVLVNSAGGQFPQDAIDFSPNGWRAVIDTNLNGSWFMMQAAARHWRDAERRGNIINIVTVVDRGMPGLAHTCAARAGIIHASRSVAVEWAPLNIRVNCLAPGIVATEGMRVYPDEARARFTDSNVMRRFASAWEIAETCAFLRSDASAFMTGEVVSVDGGGRLWGDLWPLGKPDYFATDDHQRN